MKKIIHLALMLLSGNILFAQPTSSFIDIKNISESVITEIRYATEYNFVGKRVDGYKIPKCYLTKTAAEALVRIQDKLAKQSYSLKVFDCYRPQQAVDHFVRWAESPETDSTKKYYFPNVPGDELFEQGYIAHRSGHSRGSTVDLTIVRLPYLMPERFIYSCIDPEGYTYRGSELDMGTSYDCFDEKSHTFNSEMNDAVLENRKILMQAMEEEGYVNYSKEWWHFTYQPEEFPDTYFDVPIE